MLGALDFQGLDFGSPTTFVGAQPWTTNSAGFIKIKCFSYGRKKKDLYSLGITKNEI